MNEEFVSYQQAEKLKSLGFDWGCNQWYDPESVIREYHGFLSRNHNVSPVAFSAPTLSFAAKWLREVKSYDCAVMPRKNGKGNVLRWCYIVHNLTDLRIVYRSEFNINGLYESFESALSAGIDCALTLLIDKSRIKGGTK